MVRSGPRGERVTDDSFLVMFNAHYDPLRFSPPDAAFGSQWNMVVDTTSGHVGMTTRVYRPNRRLRLEGRSLMVLQRRESPGVR